MNKDKILLLSLSQSFWETLSTYTISHGALCFLPCNYVYQETKFILLNNVISIQSPITYLINAIGGRRSVHNIMSTVHILHVLHVPVGFVHRKGKCGTPEILTEIADKGNNELLHG